MEISMTREQWRRHLIHVLQFRSVKDMSFILKKSVQWIEDMIKPETK